MHCLIWGLWLYAPLFLKVHEIFLSMVYVFFCLLFHLPNVNSDAHGSVRCRVHHLPHSRLQVVYCTTTTTHLWCSWGLDSQCSSNHCAYRYHRCPILEASWKSSLHFSVTTTLCAIHTIAQSSPYATQLVIHVMVRIIFQFLSLICGTHALLPGIHPFYQMHRLTLVTFSGTTSPAFAPLSIHFLG